MLSGVTGILNCIQFLQRRGVVEIRCKLHVISVPRQTLANSDALRVCTIELKLQAPYLSTEYCQNEFSLKLRRISIYTV
jgi:hypothetical protein